MARGSSSLGGALEVLHLLGDATRLRLLSLLAREELSVMEIVQITQLAQSRVSTHLGKLAKAGLLQQRRVGANTYYLLREGGMPAPARRLWTLLREDVKDAVFEADRKRAAELRAARREQLPWPDSIAGEMERHYSPGRTWEAMAHGLLGFLRLGDVLDIGSGDGATAGLVAPYARHVTCLDSSPHVLAAARTRLAKHDNVSFVTGDMHELPLEPECFDDVLLLNVLTYAHSPEKALREAARVLRRGGRLALITLNQHEHEAVTSAYGHVQAGFSVDQLGEMLRGAGLDVDSCDVRLRERAKPYFEVIVAFANKPTS